MAIIMKNAELFTEYLKEIHANNYSGTDDDMPEDFENWLSEKDAADLLELANEAMQLQADQYNLANLKIKHA